MDPTINGLIDEVVGQWTGEGRMFTAFEVTLELKNRGADVRHRDVKGSIHDAIQRMSGGLYTRTLMDVGAPVEAYVYHRATDNAYGYQPLQRNDPPRPTPARRSTSRPTDSNRDSAAHVDSPTAPAPVRSSPSGAFDTDDEGQLRIEAVFFQQWGLSCGDRVELRMRTEEEQIEITRCGPGGTGVTATLDHAGGLLITPDQLQQVGLQDQGTYTVTGSANSIRISEWHFTID